MTTATTTRPRPRLFGILLAPLSWLERARGWRRRWLIVAYLFVGLILGVLSWRAASLNNLPDVGDPFDVEAFIRSSRVPESEDAFVLYRQAAAAMKYSNVTENYGGMWKAVRSGWAKTPPEFHDWVASNREPLAIWRRGTLRPGGVPESPATIGLNGDGSLGATMVNLGDAALLEGSRLEGEGDRAGALEWYLAVYRSTHHLSSKSRMAWRHAASALVDQANDRLIAWASTPKTDAALLRKALAEIQAIDERSGPPSDTLKVEYLTLVRAMADPAKVVEQHGMALNFPYTREQMGHWLDAYWFLRREPERGRRVIRLFFANWLAQCDKPPNLRPRVIGDEPRSYVWGVYVPAPDTPPAGRALDPEAMFSWINSTNLVWRFLPQYPMPFADAFRDKKARGVLMVTLAEQLYLREEGKEPPSTKALVPKYLKALPDDYK